MLEGYTKFCNYRKQCAQNGILDLEAESFLYPVTLLPLIVYILRTDPECIMPMTPSVRKYLQTITDTSRFNKSRGKTYLPLVALPKNKNSANTIMKRLYEMCDYYGECGGENAFKYLIGEIVDNVYEHSEFTNALVMAQRYPKKGFMDVCFFDDGITINGCFKKHGLIGRNDCNAILEATNGVSTKSKERGFGLNSTMRIFTKGTAGEMLIISGKGGLLTTEKNRQPYTLEKVLELTGTLVGFRIPFMRKEVNIYEFLE